MDDVGQKYRDLSVYRRSVTCPSLRLWQIIDLRDTEKKIYICETLLVAMYSKKETGIISKHLVGTGGDGSSDNEKEEKNAPNDSHIYVSGYFRLSVTLIFILIIM